MFVRSDSNGKFDSRVKEFLSYVLSRQGQDEVKAGNIYLPLTVETAAAQRLRLH
jgi:ABC-type thiamine transport system substrate-binding protein